MANPADWQPRVDPQFGGGAVGMAAAALLNPYMATKGLVPGQFAPTQNFYDRFRGMEYQNQMSAVMGMGAQQDRGFQMGMLHGIANLHGTPWGEQQQKAANAALNDLAKIAPMMAQTMPQAWDQMHGRRGSAAVMSAQVFDATRFMRNSQGQMGLSAGDATRLTDHLYTSLYGQANDPLAEKRLKLMNGLRAGESGEMFGQMVKRGMVSGQDPGIIASQMRSMSGAVRAMKDVFGDMGKSDAPMQEIMETLDKVTQGGLATMDPSKMQNTVRRMHALSHMTGQSFETVAGMAAQGGAMAQASGLNKQFGLSTATSSIGFGQAFANMAGPQGFGGLSRQEATNLDQRLRTSAAKSAAGNRLGAVANLAEQGLLSGIDTNTAEGKKALQELMTNAAGMKPAELNKMLQGRFGLDNKTITGFMGAAAANEGALLRADGQDIVRGEQHRETNKVMEGGMRGAVMTSLREVPGVTPEKANQASQVVAKAMREALFSMDPAVLNDPTRSKERNAVLEAAARGALAAQGIDVPEPKLKQLVATAYTKMENLVKTHPALRQFGNVGGVVALNKKAILQQGAANKAGADQMANAANAVAGVGQGGVIERIADALNGAKPGADLGKLLGQAAGGIPIEQIQERLGPGAAAVVAQLQGGAPAKAAPAEAGGIMGMLGNMFGGGNGGAGGGVRVSGDLTLIDNRARLDGRQAPDMVAPPG